MVPALILGREMMRCRWPCPSGLPGEVGMLVQRGIGGYVRTGPVVSCQIPLLRENGSAPHNRGVGWVNFLRWLVAALLWIGRQRIHGGGVDNHLPTVRNHGKYCLL